MKVHTLDRPGVIRSLLTTEEGLSAAEANRRLQEYGPNEIREVRREPLSRRFLAQFTHFLAILLWLAAGLCLLSHFLKPGEGMLSLGVAIIGVIIINAIFTFFQEYRAERAVAALKLLLPFNVTVTREGRRKEIPAREVAPGDLIHLEEGDKVPADARLLEAAGLMVNNAPLTGEADARPRSAAPFDGDYLDSPNLVFAGTLVVAGSGTAAVVATGMATEFGKIAHLTSTVAPGLSPLQKEITRVTRIIALIAATTGLFFFGLGLLVGMSFWHTFLFAVGITIANVPEGLLPTVTLSLAMGSQRLARRRALIKSLTSVETLGSVTVICSDKTGTLTRNRMEVREVWLPPGNSDGGKSARTRLWQVAALCNHAQVWEGEVRGDPTEAALLQAALAAGATVTGKRVAEIPFDSDRKRMTTLHRVGEETLVLTKGALETVLPRCAAVLCGGCPEPLSDELQAALQEGYHALMDRGLRVIAAAFRPWAGEVPGDHLEERLEQDLIFTGLIGLEDPPRPEVPEAVRICREAGIRVIMITGDAARTAVAIAREIGLVQGEPRVIQGPELEEMSEPDLQAVLAEPEIIFARMTPRHKMRIVGALKDEGERVAVTGDGVNDAPALKRADMGIAMGLAGTDVAREAADLVLLDDNFATIVNAVEEGRAIFENIKKFMIYIFAHGTPEAVPYVLFSVGLIPLPLTVMQILAIDLGTETVPALALGAEPPEPGLMRQEPRTGGLIDAAALFRGYIFLGLISTAAVLSVYFLVLFRGGWTWGMSLPLNDPLARQAATATFLGIVMMQVGNVFACRSSSESIFKLGLFSNRLALWGIVLELTLAAVIIYHPWGQRLFDTVPLGWDLWIILAPCSLGLLLAEEVRKWYVRRCMTLPG
ncbi:MAG: cation-transporting P-type ATPase [Deltaproteobacteria bacterium]|nr:cation-transporting P-type ATPase [Deltaproteobacteria bacterium]